MSNESPVFAAAVTCIDGRVHLPLTSWIRERFDVDFVDLVTNAGADQTLCCAPDDALDDVRRQLDISVRAHRSALLVIAGHADCAANPGPESAHREQLRLAVTRARAWAPEQLDVVAAWVDEDGMVHEVD